MKVKYDLHTHSGLSPCAEDDMTPCNIVGFAAVNGLDMVAISDHNAIENVETAMAVGLAYGVTVVPAIEIQTEEDIHILCLFPTYRDLEDFYNSVEFPFVENKPEIFGNQNVYDEDDNVIATEKRLLLNSSALASWEVKKIVESFNGVAIPAHIDREANGMVAILGAVTEEFTAVELSTRASAEEIEKARKKYKVIVDSDAHTLDAISIGSEIELESPTIECLLDYLKG